MKRLTIAAVFWVMTMGVVWGQQDCPEELVVYARGEISSIRVCSRPNGVWLYIDPMVPYWIIHYQVVGPGVSEVVIPDITAVPWNPQSVWIPISGGSLAGECWWLYKVSLWGVLFPLASTRSEVCPATPTAATLLGFWPLRERDGSVHLYWKTAVEVGTLAYILEKLVVGEWERVGLLPAIGQGGRPQFYELVDEGGQTGTLYQLVEIGLDGKECVVARAGVTTRPAISVRPDDGLVVRGNPNSICSVESSTDLLTWNAVSRCTIGTNGEVIIPVALLKGEVSDRVFFRLRAE